MLNLSHLHSVAPSEAPTDSAEEAKVLALGLSTAGGDWPPLAAVVLGLSQRGHSVRYFADATIATDLRHTGVVVNAVRPEAALQSYVIRMGLSPPW